MPSAASIARLLPGLAVVALTASLGWFAAPRVYAHLGPPVAIDPAVWMILVPGRDQSMADAAEASGTGIVDGALTLCVRTFGRPDVLITRSEATATRITVTLAPDSGPLVINAHASNGAVTHIAELTTTGWRNRPKGVLHPYASTGPVIIDLTAAGVVVDGTPGGAAVRSPLELHADEIPARVTALRIDDADGNAIAEGTFGIPEPGAGVRGAGALLTLVLLGAVGLILRRARRDGRLVRGIVTVAAFGALPAAIVATPYAIWRALCERLYLLHTPAADLRTGLFLASILPVLASALLAERVLELPIRADPERPGQALQPAVRLGLATLLLAVDAAASRDLCGWQLAWALPGALFLALPWRTVLALSQAPIRALVREAPVYALLSACGWADGLLPALCWRFLCLLVDTPALLRLAPRLGADAAFVTLLALPVALEAEVRSSYLVDAWDPAQLAGASVEGTGRAAVMEPFWTGACGDEAARKRIDTFGGSSSGGAYQFKDEPEAFFPARVHERLCAQGYAIASSNFGNGGRDSSDAAAAADALYAKEPPAAVILYFGVNDLLTRDSPLTRKQRNTALNTRSATTAGLDTLSSHVRTLTGLSLLLRAKSAATEEDLVVAVPLADAEENLRRVQAASEKAGATLFLVTEYAQADTDVNLDPYFAMEKRLAAELPHTQFVDLRNALGPDRSHFLIDRNHMTREGSDKVGEVLAPLVASALDARR